MRIILGVVAAVVIALAAALAWLVFPATPGGARSLTFDGYVFLPKGQGAGALTVLDYLSVDGDRLFVTNVTTGTVYRVRLRRGVLPAAGDIATFELEPAAHGVVVDPKTGLAWVTRSGANTVDVFDPATLRLKIRIAVPDDPDGIFLAPGTIYVANGDSAVGTVIDPRARKVAATIALGGKPEFAAYDSGTKLLWQNLESTSAVVAVDLAKRTVAGRWPLAPCVAPTGMALDEAGRRLFIGCSGNSKIAIFDLARHAVVGTVDIGGGPDAVAFDPGLRRIYATGRNGVMSVVAVDAKGLRLLDTIRLHYGAHTLAVDADHRVFVGYASLFIAPRLAVFSAVR